LAAEAALAAAVLPTLRTDTPNLRGHRKASIVVLTDMDLPVLDAQPVGGDASDA
jgi:hypothetical protein